MLEFQDQTVPVAPICLPWGEDDPSRNVDQTDPNQKVVLAGWGKTTYNSTINNKNGRG